MKSSSVILPAALSLMLVGCGNVKEKGAPAAGRDAAKAAPAPAAAGKTETKAAETKAAETKAAEAKAPEAPKSPDDVIASVNGKKFLRKEMDAFVDAMLKHYGDRIPAGQRDGAREQFENRAAYSFIMKNVLLGEAKKCGIAVGEADRTNQLAKMEAAMKRQGKTADQFFKDSPLGEKAAREEFEEGLLIDKLIEKNVLDKVAVSDDEIKARIDEIKKENEEIAVRNKGIAADKEKARARIDAIKKRLEAGEDFGEIAKNESDCPSGKKNGDLGSFARGQMVKPFEDAAFSQPVGKVGGVVETQFGFHLIKVTAKTPAVAAKGDRPAEPEKVAASHILIKAPQALTPRAVPPEGEIRDSLKQAKSREAVRDYVEGLKKAAKIETLLPRVTEMLK